MEDPSMTPRGSPRKVATQDADGDSPSSNKRSHAVMAHQLEISDGSRAASPPEYEVDDDEDFARTIPSPDLHRPDVTSPPLRSASKNRHDSKSRRSPATSDENLGARTEPSHHEEDTENEDASQDESIDPGESLESFDWDDLETRYHDMVRQKSKEEEALRAEFDALCQYFNVWAQTISDHEVERSFKRIKTQTAFVQKQEHDLEQRRIHYVHVINAFKQALDLLNH